MSDSIVYAWAIGRSVRNRARFIATGFGVSLLVQCGASRKRAITVRREKIDFNCMQINARVVRQRYDKGDFPLAKACNDI